ncbi:hypothetical protein ILUMI_09562 [Ignelater luminosus]|uniref:ornithine decarboxylase n=1 Tax=Ignelater luminosus TaxID=2038154 RepID=A0A8K0CZS0_IGNLU|nr:hypothetical protein ILUMI_09562 [Ignelater luminosus]
MNTNSFDKYIHVVSGQTDLWKAMEHVTSVESQENPFYVCNVDDIIQKYMTWNTLMPRVKPHYAIKCNDHPVVLKVIASLGLGFDCATKMEIDKVLSIGVDPSRIIYAHTTKPPSHIQHAAKRKVDLMTFDNELELYKIKEMFPNARLVIRIRFDAKAAVCLGLKFGCNPYTEAQGLLEIARNLGLNVVGVSFHVGWACQDPTAFYGAIKACRHVFDVASTVGYDFNLLDIGGGYPGDSNSSIEEHAKAINSGLDEFFPDQSIRVISEPGTYFVDSAFSLACNIHSAKKTIEEDPNTGKPITQYLYYVNDGVYGSLSMTISANVIKVPKLLKKYPNEKTYPSVIWGPTCDSTDHLIKDMLLPELKLGDWIVFTDMGAYTLTLVTPFNSFELPMVYSIISKRNWLLLHKNLPFVEKDFIIDDITESTAKSSEKCYKLPESVCVKG